MSVLACDRRGCENIMCQRYSPHYGYLCDTCFEELVTAAIDHVDLQEFMEGRATDHRARSQVAQLFPKVRPGVEVVNPAEEERDAG